MFSSMICHSWFGLSLVLQFMKIDYPWLILPAHLWTHAMVYDDDDSWTVHNKPMHSICTDVLPSLTTCYKKLQRVLCRILEEKNQLSANAASIKKPWWQIRVCFFSFLAHSCGRSSWLTETECELRNRKRERGVRVVEGELTSSWFLCWGREGLIVPRRKHGELCQVVFFFTSGSECLIPPPPSHRPLRPHGYKHLVLKLHIETRVPNWASRPMRDWKFLQHPKDVLFANNMQVFCLYFC